MAIQNEWLIGLDFGKQRDSTVLSLIRQELRPLPRKAVPGTPEYDEEPVRLLTHFTLEWMWRPPLGTDYLTVVETTAKVCNHARILDKYILLADATGVGAPIIELLHKEHLLMVPISITGGLSPTQMTGKFGFNVPKKDLVDALVVVFQRGLFTYLPKLGYTDDKTGNFVDHTQTFEEELQKFVVKGRPSGRPIYEAADPEHDHDDTILSVALPIWWAMRGESYEKRFSRGEQRRKRLESDDGGWDPLGDWRR